MVYLDANVFIYPIIYDTVLEQARASMKILNSVVEGLTPAVTSYLTWDEVVWVVLKTLGIRDAIQAGYKLLAFPRLKFYEVDESVIFKSQLLIEKYNLKPRDAIHVATALISGEEIIVSDDKDFDEVGEIKRVSVVEFAHNIANGKHVKNDWKR